MTNMKMVLQNTQICLKNYEFRMILLGKNISSFQIRIFN